MTRIALAQITSTPSLARNLEKIKQFIQKAVSEKASLVFFPEASDYIAANTQESLRLSKDVPVHFLTPLQSFIKSLNAISVIIGIHFPTQSGSKTFNRLLYINPHGQLTAQYDKLHLFDVDIPAGPVLKESNSVQAGTAIAPVVDTPAGKLGLCTCYDIRFPELSLALRHQGAEILTFPSAFTVKTGEAHWEILGRARALDTQSYVVMPAQTGVHATDENGKPVRQSYGHSLVVNPWGDVVLDMGKEEGVACADIDMNLLEKVRRDMPLDSHRRRDIQFGL